MNINQGTAIGEWKLEKECPEAAFLALKCYAYRPKGKKRLVVRIKGVSKKMIANARFKSVADWLNRVTTITFEEEERYNTIKMSLIRTGSFLSASVRTKRISGKYTKRRVNVLGDTMPKRFDGE